MKEETNTPSSSYPRLNWLSFCFVEFCHQFCIYTCNLDNALILPSTFPLLVLSFKHSCIYREL